MITEHTTHTRTHTNVTSYITRKRNMHNAHTIIRIDCVFTFSSHSYSKCLLMAIIKTRQVKTIPISFLPFQANVQLICKLSTDRSCSAFHSTLNFNPYFLVLLKVKRNYTLKTKYHKILLQEIALKKRNCTQWKKGNTKMTFVKTNIPAASVQTFAEKILFLPC